MIQNQNNIDHLTPEQLQTDERYMRRCLQLARNGRQNAKPNPMVGAVIVSDEGKIIGEGYHVRCGEGHAEVNAFASVKPEDEPKLHQSTLYVSLEPCSHWGKTPPCADLIVRKGVRRVVCGCIDPFSEVQGRGAKRIREAGIAVTVGVLERECLELNRRFVTFNTRHRPYIILKWAQSANGMMAAFSNGQPAPLAFSTPYTAMLMHKLRAEIDAIAVGRTTLDTDHPQLTVRHWSGPDPLPILLSHRSEDVPERFQRFDDINTMLASLYGQKLQSLMVEGGAHTLQQFIGRGLYDEIRVETAPLTIVKGIAAPRLPADIHLTAQEEYDGNTIQWYEHHD